MLEGVVQMFLGPAQSASIQGKDTNIRSLATVMEGGPIVLNSLKLKAVQTRRPKCPILLNIFAIAIEHLNMVLIKFHNNLHFSFHPTSAN